MAGFLCALRRRNSLPHNPNTGVPKYSQDLLLDRTDEAARAEVLDLAI